MGKDRKEKIVLLTTSIFVQMSNVQQWLCLFCILQPWINLDTCRGSGTLVGGGGGDTLAGTTLETTLAGTGAGQRDVCRTRRTVLPHWQHCGSTHTHGVIADTTAVHTLSTLTAWHLDAPGSMLTLTTLLPHTDGWWTNGSVFCYFLILIEDRWFRVVLLARQRTFLPSCPKEESQQKKVKARCTLCTLHRLSDCIWTESETTASVWVESII